MFFLSLINNKHTIFKYTDKCALSLSDFYETYRLHPESGFSDSSLGSTPDKPMVANIHAINSNTKMATILTGRTTIVKNAV